MSLSDKPARSAMALAFLLAAPESTSWAEATFSYSKGANDVVLEYSRTPAELVAEDKTTSATVYGDGTVVIHFPEIHVRAGDYFTTLAPNELDQLLEDVVNAGVLEFSATEVEAMQQTTVDQTGIGFYISDPDLTTFELSLEINQAEGKAALAKATQTIELSGLQANARHFSQITQLTQLAAIERQMLELIRYAQLTPLRQKAQQ